MTGTESTLPAPPTPHNCVCGRAYDHDEVRRLCTFIGRGDSHEEGDRGLAFYNCRCGQPGTFTLVEPPPPVEPVANLLSVYQYRKEALAAGIEVYRQAARRGISATQRLFFLENMLSRFDPAIKAGEELVAHAQCPSRTAVQDEVEQMRRQYDNLKCC